MLSSIRSLLHLSSLHLSTLHPYIPAHSYPHPYSYSSSSSIAHARTHARTDRSPTHLPRRLRPLLRRHKRHRPPPHARRHVHRDRGRLASCRCMIQTSMPGCMIIGLATLRSAGDGTERRIRAHLRLHPHHPHSQNSKDVLSAQPATPSRKLEEDRREP